MSASRRSRAAVLRYVRSCSRPLQNRRHDRCGSSSRARRLPAPRWRPCYPWTMRPAWCPSARTAGARSRPCAPRAPARTRTAATCADTRGLAATRTAHGRRRGCGRDSERTAVAWLAPTTLAGGSRARGSPDKCALAACTADSAATPCHPAIEHALATRPMCGT